MELQTAIRLFSLSGVLGALLFICGDLLYNHVPGSSASPAVKMSALPERRLLAAGTLGLVGCWLYALAVIPIFAAFRPAGELYAYAVSAAFAAVAIGYGASHTAYLAIAAGAQAAARLGADAETGGKLGGVFFQRLVYLIYLPVAGLTLLMAYAVLAGKSLYPGWTVLLHPSVLYLLKVPIIRLLRGRIKEIVSDCYDNLVLLVFFVLSALVLWNAAG